MSFGMGIQWQGVRPAEADVDNPWAMRARKGRAEHLAAAIRDMGGSAESVMDQPHEWWEALAEEVELPGDPPGPITVAMTIGLLSSPGLGGLVMPAKVTTAPTCGICAGPIRNEHPTARHLGQTVHATCHHDYEEGWAHD